MLLLLKSRLLALALLPTPDAATAASGLSIPFDVGWLPQQATRIINAAKKKLPAHEFTHKKKTIPTARKTKSKLPIKACATHTNITKKDIHQLSAATGSHNNNKLRAAYTGQL